MSKEVDSQERPMFRDLHPEIQHTLRRLSRDGFIYIGREGIGLTNLFRREVLKHGTVKAIERHAANLPPEESLLLEVVAVEGPRWIPYGRVVDVLWQPESWPQDVKPIVRRNQVWEV